MKKRLILFLIIGLLCIQPVSFAGPKEAYEEAAQHNWTREAYDAYIYSGIREQDEKGRIEKAEENERNKLIVRFYENGVPLNIIVKSVGISEDDIQKVIGNA